SADIGTAALFLFPRDATRLCALHPVQARLIGCTQGRLRPIDRIPTEKWTLAAATLRPCRFTLVGERRKASPAEQGDILEKEYWNSTPWFGLSVCNHLNICPACTYTQLLLVFRRIPAAAKLPRHDLGRHAPARFFLFDSL
ncbi:MAG: hypothetical protein ACXWJ0_14755, partial [Xanthobacteraceae bacterium]